METTQSKPQDSSNIAPERLSSSARVGAGIGSFMLAGLAIALAAFAATSAWLAYKVPISAQDLHDASWLFYTDTTFLTGLLGVGFTVTMLLLGAGIGIAKQSSVPVMAAILMAVTVSTMTSQTHAFRVGVAEDSVKIGCFVWETKECRQMLGLKADGAPSMYVPRDIQDKTGKVYAGWYLKALDSRVKDSGTRLSPFGMLATPFLALRTDELNAKLQAQRADVAKLRAGDLNQAQATTAAPK